MPRDGGPAPPSDNVYISELPAGITNEELQAIFQRYAPVLQHRVLPNSSGQAKSVALVRFCSVEAATYVVSALSEGVPAGLLEPIKLRFADPPRIKGSRPGPYDAPAGGAHTALGLAQHAQQLQLDNLYIKGLPGYATDQLVRQVFGQYGAVLQCKVFNYPDVSAALVRFGSPEEAQRVLDSLHCTIPAGLTSPVEIKFYEKRGSGMGQFSIGQGDAAAEYRPPAMIVPRILGRQGLPLTAAGGYPGGLPLAAPGASAATGMKTFVAGFEKSVGNAAGREEACLEISGLPPDTEDVDLYRLFNCFGAITPRGVEVLRMSDGRCQGSAVVSFQEAYAARAAVAIFNGVTLPDESQLVVKVKSACGNMMAAPLA